MREHPAQASLTRSPNMKLLYRKFGYPPNVQKFMDQRTRLFKMLMKRNYGLVEGELD